MFLLFFNLLLLLFIFFDHLYKTLKAWYNRGSMRALLSILLLFLVFASGIYAQSRKTVYYTVEIANNDTIFNFILPEVYIFTPMKFKNEKEKLEYTKLVRDVKKTLPYAKLIAQSIIESYEMMQTFGTEKEKQKFLEEIQKHMMDEYKPKMKKLTKNQGKILVKLIYRETNASTYDIVKSLLGSFKAGFYNTFAKLFGNNLKTKYDPEGEDWMIERIAIEIEQGNL